MLCCILTNLEKFSITICSADGYLSILAWYVCNWLFRHIGGKGPKMPRSKGARKKPSAMGMAHGGGRRRGEKVSRALARTKWLEAIRQRFDGQIIGLAEVESLMPAAFTGNTRIDAVLGDTVAEAVRKGVLKETGNKQWKVLPSSGRPNGGTPEPVPISAPERDAKDQGELVEIPETEWKQAKTEFYSAFHEKRGGVTFPELQERREFFRPYAWSAIRKWFVDAQLVGPSDAGLVIRKPNTHLYRGGKDLFSLTSKGQEELVWMRRQAREVTAPAAEKKFVHKPCQIHKKGAPIVEEQFNFAALPGQSQVAGVMPAGFSKDPERQVQALILFAALAEKVEKTVTRDLYRQALRWKYQWGKKDITPVAVGRVLAGLQTHGLIDISSVREDQMPDPGDVLRIGSVGVEVLRSEQSAVPAATPPALHPAPALSVPPAQPDALEVIRRELAALTEKIGGLEKRLDATEKDRDTCRQRAEEAEARIQVFVGAFAALIGKEGLVAILQMLGVNPFPSDCAKT